MITSIGISQYFKTTLFLQHFSISVDPQNASISRIWNEYNLAYYFGFIPLGNTFKKLVDRDSEVEDEINHVDLVFEDQSEHTHSTNTPCQSKFACILSPIDILVIQQHFPFIFIHIHLIQNQGAFQSSFKKWKKLLDDYPNRKFLLNDLFFKTKMSYQKLFRHHQKHQIEKDVQWRSILCVFLWLKMNGWCPGLLGNIANFLIE